MSKSVRIEVAPDGQMKIEYDGFAGQSCFVEAEKLRLAFANIGLQVDTRKIIETKTENEVRNLENSQSVGGG